MVVARLLVLRSKLAMARKLDQETLSSSLGEGGERRFGHGGPTLRGDGLAAGGPERIEKKVTARHLEDGGLVMGDVSSAYFEGRKCELAAHGYGRDRRGDRPQIVFGPLTTPEERRVPSVRVKR
jgi:hypothetical protein